MIIVLGACLCGGSSGDLCGGRSSRFVWWWLVCMIIVEVDLYGGCGSKYVDTVHLCGCGGSGSKYMCGKWQVSVGGVRGGSLLLVLDPCCSASSVLVLQNIPEYLTNNLYFKRVLVFLTILLKFSTDHSSLSIWYKVVFSSVTF